MKGITIAIIACMCFGAGPIFEKTLMQGMTPLALAALRSLVAGILLLFLMEILHKLHELRDCSHHDMALIFLIVGLVGVFGPLLYLTGLKTTSVANTLLIGRSQALLISFFAFIWLREKLTVHQVIGTLLMITGLIVIFTRGFRSGYTFMAGDLYILGAAIIWSSTAVLIKKYLCHIPPEVIVSARNLIGGLVLCIIAFQDIQAMPLDYTLPLYLGGLALIGVVMGQFLWYTALEHTSASNVGLTSISTPIFGSVFAAFFLGEKLASYQVWGGFLVIIGLIAIEIHLSLTDIRKLECMIKHHVHFHH